MVLDYDNRLLPSRVKISEERIETSGMEFSKFCWYNVKHYDKSPADNEDAPLICSLLGFKYPDLKFYFKFILRNTGYEPEFAPGPGKNEIIQFSNILNWDTTLEVFDSWLILVKDRVQQLS